MAARIDTCFEMSMRTPSLKISLFIAGTVLLHACSSGIETGAIDGSSASVDATLATSSQAAHAVKPSAAKSLCLSVVGSADTAGTAMDVTTCKNSTAQVLTLDANGLVHVFDDMCLAADESGSGSVKLAACATSATNQQWQVQGATLVAAASQSCLTVGDSSPRVGTAVTTTACQPNDTAQAWSFGTSFASSATSATSGSGAQAPTVDVTLGIVQSGNGWPGSVNVASNSADYLGMTIDQLEASGAPIGKALKAHSDVEAAIRQVSSQTGVPSGLLAGLCYQESSFSNTAYSKNPNPSSSDSADVGITQAPLEDFSGTSWQNPTTNLLDFVNKQGFLSGYKTHKSWGYMLRIWNSGEVLNPNNLGEENNSTDANYVVEILQNHCMGKD